MPKPVRTRGRANAGVQRRGHPAVPGHGARGARRARLDPRPVWSAHLRCVTRTRPRGGLQNAVHGIGPDLSLCPLPTSPPRSTSPPPPDPCLSTPPSTPPHTLSHPPPPGAPYLLQPLADAFPTEPPAVRLALLTAAAKIFFKRPPEAQKLLGSCLAAGLGDTDQDVHDRALLYYRRAGARGGCCLFVWGRGRKHEAECFRPRERWARAAPQAFSSRR